VEQLIDLTKLMGIDVSIDITKSDLGSGYSDREVVDLLSGRADTDCSESVSIGNRGYNIKGDSGDMFNSSSDSCTNTVTRVTQVRRKRIRFSDIMDTDSESADNNCDFVEICPPVCSRTIGNFLGKPADKVEQEKDDNNVGKEDIVQNSLLGVFKENGEEDEIEIDELSRNNSYVDDLEEEMQAMTGELSKGGNEVVEVNFVDRSIHCVDMIQNSPLENNNQIPSFHLCEICDKTFPVEHDFQAHLASTHFKARLYEEFGKFKRVCPFCQKKSRDIGENMNHIGEFHSKVYEYYNDKFGVGRLRSSKINVVSNLKTFDLSSSQAFQIQRVEPTTAIKSSLRGILKSSNRKVEEQQLKGILRSSTRPHPSPCQSILKKHRSTSKHVQNSPTLFATEVSEQAPPRQFGDDVRNVVLSVQDNAGEKIVDLK